MKNKEKFINQNYGRAVLMLKMWWPDCCGSECAERVVPLGNFLKLGGASRAIIKAPRDTRAIQEHVWTHITLLYICDNSNTSPCRHF